MINLCQGKKTVFFVVVVITACFLTNGRVLAQETLVTFDGSVTDDKGDVLPGASVNLKNIEAGYTYSAVTRSSGRFIILGIEPGQYEVEVSLSGFVTQIRRGMTFTVGARITVNFQLGIATVEEKIEVIAESPLIEVTKSEISSVISRREIDDLPVLSRNFAQLATLKAGTAGGDDDIRGGGQPAGSSEVLVDGVSNEFAWYNVQRSNLPMDAIQEYRVLINQFGAEYGNATAIVLVAITKSGTNEFKGRAYAFTRNETFDTKNYFADEKEEFSQYRFGGFLGGPIQKDKLHFFLSYEGSRYKTYSIIYILIDLENIHVGDFFNTRKFGQGYHFIGFAAEDHASIGIAPSELEIRTIKSDRRDAADTLMIGYVAVLIEKVSAEIIIVTKDHFGQGLVDYVHTIGPNIKVTTIKTMSRLGDYFDTLIS